MRGSLKQRYKGSWSIILDLGYQTDPQTGSSKRRQKWVTFRGTKKQAENKMTELLNDVNSQQFVAPSKRTFGAWIDRATGICKIAEGGGRAPDKFHGMRHTCATLALQAGCLPRSCRSGLAIRRSRS